MEPPNQLRYSFGPFVLDPAERLLLRDNQPVHLPLKAFETLLALVEQKGHVVEKVELLNRVWPNTFVEEATLAQNIFTLRKVLADDGNGQEYIETIPRRGYRFVARVEVGAGTSLTGPQERLRVVRVGTFVVGMIALAAVWIGWTRFRIHGGTFDVHRPHAVGTNIDGTRNSAAYEAYLQGRYFWNQRTEEAYRKALPYFEDAIREDPSYAQAYAGLADTYALLGSLANSVLPRSEAMPEARRAAVRALELDETLAEAHTSLAFVKMQYDRDWKVAEREYKRAIELNPGYATAHHWYAYLLMAEGRAEEALVQIQLARESDPVSVVINSDVGEMYYYAHQFDRAIEHYRKTLEMDPHFLPAYWQIAAAYVHTKRYSDALEALQQAEIVGGKRPETTAWMGYVYAVSGQRSEAERRLKELEELSKHRSDLTEPISLVYAGLGQTDRMFASVQKACDERTGSVILLKVNPLLDSLHSDPRYIKTVRCLGLTPQ
ncbi:MAG TPA: tetratricopeptide repeat protein [Candidatus Acidoferrum sp.]